MIGGLSFRSLLAAAIIVPCVLTMCWLAIQSGDASRLDLLAGSVIGFVYGTKVGFKAANGKS